MYAPLLECLLHYDNQCFNDLLEREACPGHPPSSAPGWYPARSEAPLTVIVFGGNTADGLEGRNEECFHGPAFGVTCGLPASHGYGKPNLSDL